MHTDILSNQERKDDVYGLTRHWIWSGLALALLAFILIGCDVSRDAQSPATATLTPSATLRPSPIVPSVTPTIASTPLPPPTVTPEPSIHVNVLWPVQVSPLDPLAIDVTFDSIPVGARLVVSATVVQPDGKRRATFDLRPDSDGTGSNSARYVAPEPLQLPLTPASGTWWLVVHVDTTYSLTGSRVRTFTAETPPFRDLSDTLPERVTIRVPEAFEVVVATGNRKAGGRVWMHAGGALGLWWTPGPAEDLTMTTARMAVDASHTTNPRILSAPEVSSSEATTWQTRPAYRFEERWEDAGSLGVAWVIQDDQDWLYVLRLRPTEDGKIPHLLEAVAETLMFHPLED